jgi:hypothetical protein
MDVWLLAGESLELPAGLTVVIEAWPSARFQLLVPPKACAARRGSSLAARLIGFAQRHLRNRRSGVLQPSGR